ncbi:carbohydrate-binding protein, partial [Listeria monocytogenes]|nr:carbohydrate-binding protein [Listeria monocytogenes]
EKPAAPANVRSERVTSSTVALAWNGQTDAKEYNVYRDGALVATTTEPTFTDTQLKANTTYSYQVEAVGFTALVSEKSAAVKVTTSADNQVETPSTPGNLHQMSVTDSSVSLMWQASTHTNGIAGYDVYRNGVKIATATGTTYEDTNLAADTTYNYQIKAISKTGEQSAFSNQLSVKTNAKEETETPGGGESEYRVWKLGTFSAPEVYTSGEIVSHKGSNYVVINTHSNYGDTTWSPDQAPTLFQKL